MSSNLARRNSVVCCLPDEGASSTHSERAKCYSVAVVVRAHVGLGLGENVHVSQVLTQCVCFGACGIMEFKQE